MYVVSSIGVYQPPVQGSVLGRFQTLREFLQMFGELCAQLGVISQPVAVQIKQVSSAPTLTGWTPSHSSC